ncbi:unnamed protein product [Protopolystoma xenopodis]|uniref:Uncharacterized protein n=1 Tax=Protopolystoma xenopodis TaxID=117903 RepID=A0A3S5FEF9_9PLAT|nr:unnamed protein product [Protopolystoma xenopodis]
MYISSWHSHNSEYVRHLAISGLNFLDMRAEFWQQQKPVYARNRAPSKHPDEFQEEKLQIVDSKRTGSIMRHIVCTLEEIDESKSYKRLKYISLEVFKNV